MEFKIVRKSNKKGRFSKGILVAMLVFLLLFTVATMFIAYKTGQEPSTLVTCVFAFCGAEGGFLAFIKKAKETNKEKSDVDEY